MSECARACEHHRDTIFIADFDRLFVARATARLDDRGDAGAAGVLHRVALGEREESVRGDDRARDALTRTLDRLLGRPEAVRLTAADADRRPFPGDDDGVRPDVLSAPAS